MSFRIIFVYYLSSSCCLLSYVNSDAGFCGPETNLMRPKGNIETVMSQHVEPTNCTWTITSPNRSVIHIRLEYLQLGSSDEDDGIGNEESCLLILNPNKSIVYLRECSDTTHHDTLSLPTNEALISLESTSESHLSLSYTSYIVNCTYDQLKCYNARYFSQNVAKNEICAEGMLLCEEKCRFGRVTCADLNVCYDVYEQRCDDKLDCPGGEDESGCQPYTYACPDQIGCLNESKCLSRTQLCDHNPDCRSGFDEYNCNSFECKTNDAQCFSLRDHGEEEAEQTDIVYMLTIVFSVMLLLFIYLICRCLTKRDRVRNMMENPLEVPLPPFRGPGESSNPTDDQDYYHDEDFRPGGEIYESFFSNVNQIKSKRKRDKEAAELKEMEKVTFVQPPDGHTVLNKYFNGIRPVLSEEFAALATIKISRDMCYGLRKAKSEEKPMTRLLFIDAKDEESSDEDSDSDDKWNKPSYSKSDTDYFRRKNPATHRNRV